MFLGLLVSNLGFLLVNVWHLDENYYNSSTLYNTKQQKMTKTKHFPYYDGHL